MSEVVHDYGMRLNVTLFLLLSLTSCSFLKKNSQPFSNGESDLDSEGRIVDLDKILSRSEEQATPVGKEILITGRSMIENKRIIRGSCWDYANAVYNQAGFPAHERITPLKSKIKGPYADLTTIQAGDWLYFINFSFKEIDHSGIFVEWTDFDAKRAVVLSYVGGRKKKPGNYKIYDLKKVYYIVRPKEH